jgi:hypothetical protein
MGQDKNPPATIMKADSVQSTPEPEDDITPTLSARRPVIKFAEQLAKLGLVRMQLRDAAPS